MATNEELEKRVNEFEREFGLLKSQVNSQYQSQILVDKDQTKRVDRKCKQIDELEQRLDTLEAQAREDNSMVFKKAPNIVNRLLVAYDRLDAMYDAHHALCDVLDGVFYILKEHLVIDESSMNYSLRQIVKARLPQEDKLGAMREHWEKTQPSTISESDMKATLGGRYEKPQETQPKNHIPTKGIVSEDERRERELDALMGDKFTVQPQEVHIEPQDSANEDDKRDTPNPVLQSGSADMESMSVDAIMGEAQDDVIDVMSMASHLKTYKLVEAQDETQDFTYEDDGVVKEAEQGNEQCENGSVPLLGSTETVDALMGEIRVNVETIFSDALYDEKPYEKCYRQYTERVMVYVSPIIERLVRERNEAVALDKDSCNRIDVLIRQREEQQIRAVGAEWANKELSRSEAYWKERAERAEAERDAMKECVDVLRDHHSAKYHGDWFYRRENALANYDKAQKGGGE